MNDHSWTPGAPYPRRRNLGNPWRLFGRALVAGTGLAIACAAFGITATRAADAPTPPPGFTPSPPAATPPTPAPPATSATLPAALVPPGETIGATLSAHQLETAIQRAVAYLQTKGQAADGSFGAGADGPGVTAVVTTGLLRVGRSPEEPTVLKALKFLEKSIQPDGGIYPTGSNHQNYETCCAIMALMNANADHRYDKVIKNAEKYVREVQWDVPEGHDRNSPNFGGAGYGGSKRPDLSNTSFLMDVLKASGAGPEDEAVKNALVFVSRCQNLESENNTTPFAAKVHDGGFYYTPASGGGSGAGTTPDGGLRSYGAMTYAGLKCMIFAGVGPADPRVQAAFKWIQNHYTLDENPGLGQPGLYYYYQTFAKSLDALGHEEIEDADGNPHRWRSELAAAVVKRQRPDGSWSNDAKRWMEGDPNLVTGYALMTLSYCKPHKSGTP